MLKSNNENQVYTSLGIKLDGALMKAKQEYFYRPYENNYESLDIASVESKSLTLALSPSLHLKEEKAIFELGLNINLLTWIDYNGDVYHYYNLSNGKQIIESDNKINFKEIVTPKNTLRSRTMFFSIFLTYNFKMFKK
jgi:hypothetical protein